MQSTVEASAPDAQAVSNVIFVAACPIDKVLNRSKGVLGNAHQCVCRKCGALYTMPSRVNAL